MTSRINRNRAIQLEERRFKGRIRKGLRLCPMPAPPPWVGRGHLPPISTLRASTPTKSPLIHKPHSLGRKSLLLDSLYHGFGPIQASIGEKVYTVPRTLPHHHNNMNGILNYNISRLSEYSKLYLQLQTPVVALSHDESELLDARQKIIDVIDRTVESRQYGQALAGSNSNAVISSPTLHSSEHSQCSQQSHQNGVATSSLHKDLLKEPTVPEHKTDSQISGMSVELQCSDRTSLEMPLVVSVSTLNTTEPEQNAANTALLNPDLLKPSQANSTGSMLNRDMLSTVPQFSGRDSKEMLDVQTPTTHNSAVSSAQRSRQASPGLQLTSAGFSPGTSPQLQLTSAGNSPRTPLTKQPSGEAISDLDSMAAQASQGSSQQKEACTADPTDPTEKSTAADQAIALNMLETSTEPAETNSTEQHVSEMGSIELQSSGTNINASARTEHDHQTTRHDQQVRPESHKQVRPESHQQARYGSHQQVRPESHQQVRPESHKQVTPESHQQTRSGSHQQTMSGHCQRAWTEHHQEPRTEHQQQTRTEHQQQTRTGHQQGMSGHQQTRIEPCQQVMRGHHQQRRPKIQQQTAHHRTNINASAKTKYHQEARCGHQQTRTGQTQKATDHRTNINASSLTELHKQTRTKCHQQMMLDRKSAKHLSDLNLVIMQALKQHFPKIQDTEYNEYNKAPDKADTFDDRGSLCSSTEIPVCPRPTPELPRTARSNVTTSSHNSTDLAKLYTAALCGECLVISEHLEDNVGSAIEYFKEEHFVRQLDNWKDSHNEDCAEEPMSKYLQEGKYGLADEPATTKIENNNNKVQCTKEHRKDGVESPPKKHIDQYTNYRRTDNKKKLLKHGSAVSKRGVSDRKSSGKLKPISIVHKSVLNKRVMSQEQGESNSAPFSQKQSLAKLTCSSQTARWAGKGSPVTNHSEQSLVSRTSSRKD